MAERFGNVPTQGFQQIVRRALSTYEIVTYIDNHRDYITTMPPPHKPPNGSVILYDTTMGYDIRKDGHEWKEGVQERHCPRRENGDVVLQGYIMDGRANENFQRRIYWKTEKEVNSHIALVHYVETERKGRTKAKKYENGVVLGEGGRNIASYYEKGSSSGTNGFDQANKMGITPAPGKPLVAANFGTDLLRYIENFDSSSVTGLNLLEGEGRQGTGTIDQLANTGTAIPLVEADQQCDVLRVGENPVDHLQFPLEAYATSSQTDLQQSEGAGSGSVDPQSVISPVQVDNRFDDSCFGNNDVPDLQAYDDVIDFSSLYASPSDTGEPKNATDEGLDTIMVESSAGLNDLIICSVKDFSPACANQNTETKVLICGTFSNSNQGESCQWYCVFGEDEVHAEHLTENVLRCFTPQKKAGRVPFYVKTSTGSVHSEMMEFEFRVNGNQDNHYNICRNEMSLVGLDRLLRLSSRPPTVNPSHEKKVSQLKSEIDEILLVQDTIDRLGEKQGFAPKSAFTDERTEEWYKKKEECLIDTLREWLFQKVNAGGEGLGVLDKGGQGVLHYAAALGFYRILESTVTAGLQVDSPDVNGWTSLHWAAYSGSETTVYTLIRLGADPGALTSKGDTPAELASSQEHHDLAGFLLERADISHASHPKLESKQDHCAEDMEIVQVETQDPDNDILEDEEKPDEHSHHADSMQPPATSKAKRAFRKWVQSVKHGLSDMRRKGKSLSWKPKVSCACFSGCKYHV